MRKVASSDEYDGLAFGVGADVQLVARGASVQSFSPYVCAANAEIDVSSSTKSVQQLDPQ